MNEIIQDLTVHLKLSKEALKNLDRAGYLNNHTGYYTTCTIREYGARATLNKMISAMIEEQFKDLPDPCGDRICSECEIGGCEGSP